MKNEGLNPSQQRIRIIDVRESLLNLVHQTTSETIESSKETIESHLVVSNSVHKDVVAELKGMHEEIREKLKSKIYNLKIEQLKSKFNN